MSVETRTKKFIPPTWKRMLMSKDEFKQLPEGPPFYDYVDGEAVEVNRPTGKHQQIMFRLSNLLWEHVRASDLGDVYADIDVELPTGNVYGPDIVFLSKEHLDRYDESSGDIIGAPDLVIEILSPSTECYDRITKMNEYHASGVPWVWLIQQDSLLVEEYRWSEEGYIRINAVEAGAIFRPKAFPGLEIDLKKLMRE